MSQQTQPDVVKRYLLGVLPEEEQDRFEEQYFSDNVLFEEVELAEDDLVDRYIRNELPPDDRRLFEQALSGSSHLKERVEFAKLLKNKTAPQPQSKVQTVAQPGFWQRIFSPQQHAFRYAFSFAVLVLLIPGIAVVIGWINLRQQSASLAARYAELKQRNDAIAKQLAEEQAENEQRAKDLHKAVVALEADRQAFEQQVAEQPLNLIARLMLEPGATRAEGSPPKEFTLNRNYSTLILTLPLLDSDYPRYRTVVVTPDRKPISKLQTLPPKNTADGKFLILSVPLKGIKPGDYFVRVEGIDESGKIQPVDNYPFHLNAPSK